MNRRREPISSDQRRHQIEETLIRYPHLTSEQLTDLIKWFKSEATAMEVATLASDPDLYPQYRSFRTKHVDKFTLGELTISAGFAAVLIVTVAALLATP